LLFDTYCDGSKLLDAEAIQELCYDVGVYYTLDEVHYRIKSYAGSDSNNLNYDGFMVFWRSNLDFRLVNLL
jgi:hypothetical protein